MTILYFDCFSGVAGDMVLGAFLDIGMPLTHLKKELRKLGVGGFALEIKPAGEHDIAGTNLHVKVVNEPAFERYRDIEALIKKSRLKKNVKETSLAIFKILASAEGRVHRRKVSDVHFHEVGGLDSIIDIVGTAIAVDYFKFEKIYSSPLPITKGRIKCAHGWLPVPAPATTEIIKGLPLEPSPIKDEIVTPTGAAILKALCSNFGSSPLRKIEKVGYGFGDKKYAGHQNALRAMIGEGHPLYVIEANIDDMNPEFYPFVIEKLLQHGAIDTAVIPVIMKKGRPGSIVQVLCEENKRKALTEIILKETTTFGVRYFPVEREMCEREFKKVRTKWGVVRVKTAKYKGGTVTVSPEFSDCEKIAKKCKVPLKDVYREAIVCGDF